MGRVIIVGTSHIASESVAEVERVISDYNPEVVALELDRQRLYSLLSKRSGRIRWSDVRMLGARGFAVNAIGAYIEKRLGKMVGSTPGDEMRKAVEMARGCGARIALIDQDIRITLRKLTERVGLKEKGRLAWDIVRGLVGRGEVGFDLRKVPDRAIIEKLTKKVKMRYPSVYAVLIEERNVVMAKGLYKLMGESKGKVVAVVGAGHENGVALLLKKMVAK